MPKPKKDTTAEERIAELSGLLNAVTELATATALASSDTRAIRAIMDQLAEQTEKAYSLVLGLRPDRVELMLRAQKSYQVARADLTEKLKQTLP